MSDLTTLFIIPGACSLGSQITLEYLNIPYNIGITTPEIRASEEFRKINPAGKVGALKDGDIVIGENLAILLYLADKYPDKKLVAAVGSEERVKTYQWLSYLSSTLHPAFSQNLHSKRFIDDNGMATFKKLAYERLLLSLEYINQELRPGFFVGDKLTIVDMQAYGLLRWTIHHKVVDNLVDLKPFPFIADFLAKMADLQPVKNALAIEENNLKALINSQFSGYFVFNS